MGETLAFGSWLKRCRQERGLTQDALADRVGCATQTIRKIEGGQRRPSYQMAERLAQVLELALDERPGWMHASRDSSEKEVPAPLFVEPRRQPLLHNFPAYLTPFVGRAREQTDLTRLLQAPDCRLVTVLGPGGVGKTRLATEVASQIAAFPDGIVFVSLAPLATAQAVVPAIGDGFGFTFSGTTELASQLMAYLRDKHALLVLDNLEHLLDQGGTTLELIRRLLAQAPQVTLLVTSRERLRLPGEWLIEIEGLAVPPADVVPASTDYPALTLFLEHAQRARHGFVMGADNYEDISRICRLVGGIPLGIELAAAWMRLLSPAEIGQELARDLNAYHLSSGTAPPRHHSLRAVVEHSWRLLPDSERQVLSKLAVFQGGFSRDAAAQVAGASLAVLATLADKSLVRRAAVGHYELHEIIRQYAALQLHDNQAEYITTHDCHAEYFTAWLAQRERALLSSRQLAIIAEINGAIDNIRAAWQWSIAQGHLNAIADCAETLHWFYEFRGWYQEGADVFSRAVDGLRRPSQDDADDALRRVRGRMLGHYAYLVSRLGRLDQAWAAVEESRGLLEQSSDRVALARTAMYRGMLAIQMGDYELARSALAESRGLAGADDYWAIAFGESWGCMLANALGNYHEAERLFHAALGHYRILGSPRGLVFCLTFCSITLIALGKYQEVQTRLHESLELAAAADDRFGKAIVLQHLGLVSLELHDSDEAVTRFREALNLLRQTGNRWEIARALNQLGAALANTSAVSETRAAYSEALAMALEAQAIPDALQALAGIAALLQEEGRYILALELVTHILAEPAGRSETREQAMHIRAMLGLHLSSEQIAMVEETAKGRLLSAMSEDVTALLTCPQI